MQHADVRKVVLQDLACSIVRRKIARNNLHTIAHQHKLLIVLRTEDDHNIFYYGNQKDANAFRVELALIKTSVGEHYIHYFKTDINAYALKHYDSLKNKKAWWTIKSSDGRKDASRGMHSLSLMKHLRDSGSLKSMDITEKGIFMTQYHDRLSRMEYATLEYPHSSVRLTHPERSYGRLFGRGEDIDDDVEAMKDILRVDELDETQIKTLQNAMKLHDQYAALPDHMRAKLDEKMLTKRFTLDEQLATMKRAIPPSAVVFFDFESSPFGEHSPYGVCYSDYNEDAVHSIRGADCAEALMDELLEVYGADCPDDIDWGKFKPPVIKLMAHNATYDYSFLFEHLRRVKFLEKGTSLICGTALVSNECMRVTESPNAQIVRWMTEDAWETAERDNKLRRQWRRCLQNLRKTSTFVTVDNLHVISRGAIDVVAFLRDNAPFDGFEPEMIAKRTYRALSISLQDTYKMIPMPLSQFGKSFNLQQSKEVMPHALMTREFVDSGGVATVDDVRKAVYEMHVNESDLVNKLTRLVGDHGGVEAVRKLGCRVHATVVDGDSELWLKIDFNYAPDDLGLRLDELHAKKAHLAAYHLLIEHYGNDDALRSLVYEDLLAHVIAKAREYDCEVSPGHYDMIEYSMHYCAIDVQVLKDGWRVFHDLLFDKFALSTLHFPTLAGLADRYFIDEGCFEGVCEVSGVVQSFIAQCSVGGRVMCAHNKRSHVKGKIADFDGVSLYPSSMDRLGTLDSFADSGMYSMVEPVNDQRVEELIAFIETYMDLLKPRGECRKHDKVRDVHEYLVGLRERPARVHYKHIGGWGRLYPTDCVGNARTKSMQGCFKGLRSALVGHVAHDIDLENSLPSITVQQLDKLVDAGELSIKRDDYRHLRDYVDRRQAWRDEISKHHGVSKDVAKEMTLIATFGGDPSSHYATLGVKPGPLCPKLKSLVEEIRVVRAALVEHLRKDPVYDARYLARLEKKAGNHEDAARSFFSLYVQTIEESVMRHVRDYLALRGVNVTSLIHDGVHADQCSEELMRGAEEYVAARGWVIRLAEKQCYGMQNARIPELDPIYELDAVHNRTRQSAQTPSEPVVYGGYLMGRPKMLT
ncbi:hypothetical protein AB1Y20_008226 [Prymnesium parvum]|uniref:DNA-directed DNA polymerase n=1 Tax=Prymnesium parvum TaxID=97485 RepID=A0AB34IU91_PRYPA